MHPFVRLAGNLLLGIPKCHFSFPARCGNLYARYITMEVIKNIVGDTLEAKVTGKLDTSSAAQLDADLKEDIAKAKLLELDFAELEYISSAGLRLLLLFAKQLGGKDKVQVKNANAVVKDIFRISGFAKIVTVL